MVALIQLVRSRLVLRMCAALALLTVVAATTAAAPADAPQRYIVVLRENVSDPGAIAREHAQRYGAQVGFVYTHALKGYSAVIPSQRVDEVRGDPRVAYLEIDGTVTATAQTLPWGIDRVDADASTTLAGNGSGSVAGVNAYIIDTGIDRGHSDLDVVHHVNFAGGPNADCNGHGTHVAGTVAARDNLSDVVGIAPGVLLTGVKVLGCNGSGSTSGVIAGIDWVTGNAVKPAVANMSLGGSASQALDDAVVRSSVSGVFYAIAAGNSGTDACSSSPARVGGGTSNGIMTVGAVDSGEREASWSNYGNCVDVWAPGVNILSTRKGGGTTTMSGTSMASPHVAGGAALYLASHQTDGPAMVEAALTTVAVSTGTAASELAELVEGFAQRVHCRDGDLHQVGVLAGNAIALDDCLQTLDELLERARWTSGERQRHRDKGHERPPDAGRIDVRVIAANYTGRLQPSDPLSGRRAAEPYRGPEIAHRHSAVALQKSQDAGVDLVETRPTAPWIVRINHGDLLKELMLDGYSTFLSTV